MFFFYKCPPCLSDAHNACRFQEREIDSAIHQDVSANRKPPPQRHHIPVVHDAVAVYSTQLEEQKSEKIETAKGMCVISHTQKKFFQ